MKLKWIFSVAAFLVHAITAATPVDRQVDAPRTRVAPNKMATLGGPKSAVMNRPVASGKTKNQSIGRAKNAAPKAAHV